MTFLEVLEVLLVWTVIVAAALPLLKRLLMVGAAIDVILVYLWGASVGKVASALIKKNFGDLFTGLANTAIIVILAKLITEIFI